MRAHDRRRAFAWWAWPVVALALLPGAASAIEGKAGVHLIRMVPSGADAERFSNPGWGGASR